MTTLSSRSQWVIGTLLALLMIITRDYHFVSLNHLPGASWAVFLLAGIYLSSHWALPALLALAAGIDFAAISWGGVSDFCITPAYGFLIPAYAALWFAGRWYRNQQQDLNILWLTGVTVIATLSCELISSGSFYFLGGRFAEATLSGFVNQLWAYFPSSLFNVGFYVAAAAVIQLLFAQFNKLADRNKLTDRAQAS